MLIALSSFPISHAYADVNDFVINDFSADYYLTNDDRQGTLRVTEQIDLTYSDNNHGILRAIPATYNGHSLKLKINQVSSATGAPSQFSTYSQNGNTVLKIGAPNQTVTGHQRYTIEYTVNNVIGFYPDHDELYWDINGADWQQPFEHVAAVVHLPTGLKVVNRACFAGPQGTSVSNCDYTESDDSIRFTTSGLLNNTETLTVVVGFNKGFFTPATWYDQLADYAPAVLSFMALPVLLGGGAFLYWLKRGRDSKGRSVIVAEYEPPDQLKPIEVGTIADFKVDNRDISATFIDLAVRGYLTITEETEKKLLRDKKVYSLKLKNPDFSNLDYFEQKLLEGVFNKIDLLGLAGKDGLPAEGMSVRLNEIKGFYTVARDVRDDVSEGLTTEGYFRGNPLKSGKFLSGLSMMVFVLVYIFVQALSKRLIHTGAFIAGAVIAAYICTWFARIMPSRTAKGVAAKEHIRGLKLYLEVAEKDRLKMLQSPDAPYATPSSEPVKTIELFEKLLPFAIVLGVENEWAKKFEGIFVDPPDWYSGNWSTFNAVYFASSVGDSVAAMGTTFAPPSNSGSSGFSGGFSGGGGGGGGGGGW